MFCPYCKKYVNVIIHNYHYERETCREKRCEVCGKTILVDHYPKRTLEDKLSDPNYTEGKPSFEHWVSNIL